MRMLHHLIGITHGLFNCGFKPLDYSDSYVFGYKQGLNFYERLFRNRY